MLSLVDTHCHCGQWWSWHVVPTWHPALHGTWSSWAQPSPQYPPLLHSPYMLKQKSLPWISVKTCKFSKSFNKLIDYAAYNFIQIGFFFRRKWVQKLLLSQTTVTMCEAQGHFHWYQNIKLQSVYQVYQLYIWNQSVNVRIPTNIK